MNTPRFTAIVDTYNHEQFIERAIESVLEQDFPAEQMEVIVVDDGSTDATPARIAQFGDRVRYLRKENGGQASAFNCAVPHARGEVVAFCDGDDWWAKEKLSVLMELFDRHPEVGIIGHGYFHVEQPQPPYPVVGPDREYILELRTRGGAERYRQLKAFLGASKVAIRRELFAKILPIPEELVIEADEYMFTLAVALSEARVLPQPLFYYRFHENNLFQIQTRDEQKIRRKGRVLDGLVRTLPPALERAGVLREAIDIVMEPLRVDATHIRLHLDGGWPWETFAVERALLRLSYQNPSFGYRAFKAGVLGLSLVLPPRAFYRLKQWYSRSGASEVRRVVGEGVAAAPVVTTHSRKLETGDWKLEKQ
jgi:glycosyltransferase involved in cell wall biosynthesis